MTKGVFKLIEKSKNIYFVWVAWVQEIHKKKLIQTGQRWEGRNLEPDFKIVCIGWDALLNNAFLHPAIYV